MPDITTAKRLAIGTLTTSLADLYVVPVVNPTTVRITHLRVTTGSVADTITLLHNDGTTGYHLLNGFAIEANSYEDIFDLILSPGDKIEGQAGASSNIDFLIYGLETEAIP